MSQRRVVLIESDDERIYQIAVWTANRSWWQRVRDGFWFAFAPTAPQVPSMKGEILQMHFGLTGGNSASWRHATEGKS